MQNSIKEIFDKINELDALIRDADFAQMTDEEKSAVAAYVSSLRKRFEDAEIEIAKNQLSTTMKTKTLQH